MKQKKNPKRGSHVGWILTLGFLTAAVFTVLAMKPSRSPEPPASSTSSAFSSTAANTSPALDVAPPGMVWIPGGEFSMGTASESESLCTMPGMTHDASPIHRVYVDGFWMDATELTNAEFEKFVEATGYVTIAERTPT